MIAVVDASTVANMAVRPSAMQAESAFLADCNLIHAPDLFVSEITNVFWKYFAFGGLPQDEAEAGLAFCLSVPTTISPCHAMHEEAFMMACLANHSAYDMMYLVLARRHSAILVTGDKKLKRLAKAHGVRVFES